MRFGLLNLEGNERSDWSTALFWLGGPFVAFGLVGIGDPVQRMECLIFILAGSVVILGGALLRRGGGRWRAGERRSSGVLWDSSSVDASEGRFLLRIGRKPEAGAGGINRSHTVLNVYPMVENTVHRIEDHTPKLVVGIWATRDSVYSARFSSFGGRSIPSGQNPKMSILLGSRLTMLDGSMRNNLRALGKALSAAGLDGIEIELFVMSPFHALRAQGGVFPGGLQTGGAVVGALTGAPIAGAIAGAAVGRAMAPTQQQVDALAAYRVRAEIFGDPGKRERPAFQSLKSIAEEFGWTITSDVEIRPE